MQKFISKIKSKAKITLLKIRLSKLDLKCSVLKEELISSLFSN